MAKTYYDWEKDRIVVEIGPCQFMYVPERDKQENITDAVFPRESSKFTDGRHRLTSGDMNFLSILGNEADKKARSFSRNLTVARAWTK